MEYKEIGSPYCGHKVVIVRDMACVKFDYRGFEISLACDGEDTMVYDLNKKDNNGRMFEHDTIPETGAVSVRDAMTWIDNYILRGGKLKHK